MSSNEAFLDITNRITRKGIVEFLVWLTEDTDFLTAPASTKYHGAEKGGLLEHSLCVFDNLVNICALYDEKFTFDTIAIVSLFHDICKVNFYSESTRNVKNDITGMWEKVPYYSVNEEFPYGSHGGKSVYLLLRHGLEITDEEAVAINNHMGGWDYTNYHNPSNAFNKFPLAVYLHVSDVLATYVDKA